MHSYPFISEEDFFSSCKEIIKVFNATNASAVPENDWLAVDMRSQVSDCKVAKVI